MIMLHASTQKLIQKLCELTASGDIAWSEGERASSRFETEGYIVEVEADPTAVRILDVAGRELEHADAAQLASTPWPGGGGDYARHVSDMARAANRVARGAERAISRILSSLSAPPSLSTPPQAEKLAPEPEPVSVALEFEHVEPPIFSTVGGSESEAAMAAAVADMALRLSHAPLEAAASDPAPASPAPVETPPMASAAPPSAPAPAFERRVRTLPQGPTGDLPPSADAFGRTRGFSLSARSVPPSRASTPAPVSPPVKITATGLVLSGIHATTHQTPRHYTPPPRHDGVRATPYGDALGTGLETGTGAADIVKPAANPNAYKPWS